MYFPGNSTLLVLPREIRDIVYKEVIVIPHPLFIFQQKGSQTIKSFVPKRPRYWISLLLVNRQLHVEASAALYRCHNFNLVDAPNQLSLLQSFLARIGPSNACNLLRIGISFPILEKGERGTRGVGGQLAPREDDLRGLELLQKLCTNLVSLEFFVQGQTAKELCTTGNDAERPRAVRGALAEMDALLKTTASSSSVKVKFFGKRPHPDIARAMQHLGWEVINPGR